MNVESWITVEETPALAAEAMAVIDARLARLTDAERGAFWASIRKAYNTPYNDPEKPAQPKPVEPAPGTIPSAVEIRLPAIDPSIDLPAAALASATFAAEMRAA
ncbi:hypothetical protein [Methylorubrum extorquens]|uniref:hypothetical protein n=1 Tax=Methylorubrum extorquens TaxID=408 RepID=UPI000158FD33|nr:hypothetical protein [Methylorubrum extorquens]ABY31677.1 hypothetical protein Mext_3290 [Methylorubrum extorquens PA1]KQP86958.1 hypothetical protein ASF55_11195 [Methylobacterium sp. Leaf119]WIU38301.1 hypothetical protein KQ926_17035 [Methylorubrum extorquens]